MNPVRFYPIPDIGDVTGQGLCYTDAGAVPSDRIYSLTLCNRLLSGIKIDSLSTLADAITILHKTYSTPHIIVTSVHLPPEASNSSSTTTAPPPNTLSIIGSTARSDGSPRLFKVEVPAIDCFFSGTGDMFAALTVARLREEIFADSSNPIQNVKSWVSPDEVEATDLPLSKATVKVLASMHDVLEKTMEARTRELEESSPLGSKADQNALSDSERQKIEHLRRTKAAEVRLVRNAGLLRDPVKRFTAQAWTV